MTKQTESHLYRAVIAMVFALGSTSCASEPERPKRAARSAALTELRTVTASGDTYIKAGSPNQNQGSEPIIRVTSTGKNRGLLFFDPAAIQAAIGSGTLVTASLELTLDSAASNWGATGRPIAVHRVLQAGAEYASTWNCAQDESIYNSLADCSSAAGTAWSMDASDPAARPWLQSASATALLVNGQTGTVSFDVTPDIAAILSGSWPGYAFLLKNELESQSGLAEFASREGGQGPRLLLEVDVGGAGVDSGPGMDASVDAGVRSRRFVATADTQVRQGEPNHNFGTISTLRIQASGRYRALVDFDESAVGAALGSDGLLSARLELGISQTYDDWGTDRSLGAHRLRQGWTELGATWNCSEDADPSNSTGSDCVSQWVMWAPNLPLEQIAWHDPPTDTVLIANGQTGVVSFDVSRDLACHLAGHLPFHGFIVKKEAESQSGRIDLASRETGNPPALVIEYAPGAGVSVTAEQCLGVAMDGGTPDSGMPDAGTCMPTGVDDDCDAQDDDCDGAADEAYEVSDTQCGQGACAATGERSCEGGFEVDSCTAGSPGANDATCNGSDDDCDGVTDEGFAPEATTCGLGVCARTGSTSCVNGAVQDSCAPGTPAAGDGSCNGADDDCNGAVDEDFTSETTSCGVGACARTGQTSCDAGVVHDSCQPGSPGADDSTCNGVDEDCSGAADEDFTPVPTTCGIGACARSGVTSCASGVLHDSCIPGTAAGSDASCDAVDQDCNGSMDEDYVSQPTSCGVGACAATGATSCVLGSEQNSCTPGTPAASDATCNNSDDDCNGAIDEDYVTTCSGTLRTFCSAGQLTAADCRDENACNGEESCANGTCQPGTPLAVDDGNACTTDSCDPATGSVSHTPAPEGSSCSDGNVCNGEETCQFGTPGCVVLPSGAVALWPGDGHTEDIIANLDGAPVNGLGFASGRVGQAFSFDGTNDYLNVSAHVGALNVGPAATIELWLRTTVDVCRTIFSMRQDNTHDQFLRIGNFCDNTLTNEIVTWLSRNGAVFSVLGSTTGPGVPRTLFDGNFHHLAVTFDGTDTRIYIDGASQPITIVAGADHGDFGGLPAPVNATIGTRLVGASLLNIFGGQMDEVTLYNRALSAAEIAAIHAAGAAGKCAGQGGATGCSAGVPPNLDDGNLCTLDSCDPQAGVVHAPAPTSTPCNDGNLCTETDHCDGAGQCTGAPVAQPPSPSDASCDGVDEDCDGTTDDDYASVATSCGVGVCSATGSSICIAGAVQNNCTPGAPTGSDTGCDGDDDDCDGAVDEAVVLPDDGDPCTTASCENGVVLHTPLPENVVCSPIDRCSDGADNDGDQLVDCLDPDCRGFGLCDESGFCADGQDNDIDGFVDCQDSDCADRPACIAEICGNSLDEDADQLFDCADDDCDGVLPCSDVAPDPAAVAPPLDRTVATSFSDALSFLYTGGDPIQRGVVPEAIEETRAALVSGRVVQAGGQPLSAARISILGHPELGFTRTQASGEFDLVVNGGDLLTISYELEGYLPAQRQIEATWNRSERMPDVVLLPVDPNDNTIYMTTSAYQVARGSVETDEDGSRRATLVVPGGVRAEVTLHDGTVVPADSVGSLTVRATEYTVGPDGGKRMPAELPAASEYTYAVELSADGAKAVLFDRPLPFYVENFLEFPVGTGIPLGFYDRERGVWVASDNGIVLGIVAITAGSAEVDLDGDGLGDSPSVLLAHGITAEEQQLLASLYVVGQQLWRLEIPHFCPWDANMAVGPIAGADYPNGSIPKAPKGPPAGSFNCPPVPGSSIGCLKQVLGESVPVTGTPFELHYSSDRVIGHATDVTLNLGTTQDLQELPYFMIKAEFQPALGEAHSASWLRDDVPSSYTYTWPWNGEDSFERLVMGAMHVDVTLTYYYPCAYNQPSRFGYRPNQVSFVFNSPRDAGQAEMGSQIPGSNIDPMPCNFELKQKLGTEIAGLDYRELGIGGWGITPHHFYDPASQLLVRGDGEQVRARALPSVMSTFVQIQGLGLPPSADGGFGSQEKHMVAAPDGSLYVTDDPSVPSTPVLYRISTDGTVSVAGAWVSFPGPFPESVSETLATQVVGRQLSDAFISPNVQGLDLGPDGSLYLGWGSAGLHDAILRVDPAGLIHWFAGNGESGAISPDGGLAVDTPIAGLRDLVVSNDGTVYFSVWMDPSLHKIRAVDPEGRLQTVAGGGALFQIDGVVATDAQLNRPRFLALGPGDELYFVQSSCRIYRIDRAGIIHLVAGTIQCRETAVGLEHQLATTTRLPGISDIGFDDTGTLYFSTYSGRIHFIDQEGRIGTFVGDDQVGPCIVDVGGSNQQVRPCNDPETNSIAAGTETPPIDSFAFGPDRRAYFTIRDRVKVVQPPQPGSDVSDIIVPSEAGDELYVFDSVGRHKSTRNALTGETVLTFGYTAEGRLETITDGDGNVTQIEREASGQLTAIIAPFGQRTELLENADGYLERIDPDPDNPPYTFTYDGASGLLASMIDPRVQLHEYDFEAGNLTEDRGPDGRVVELEGAEVDGVTTVHMDETDAGRTTYSLDVSTPGALSGSVEFPDGSRNDMQQSKEGRKTATLADGTVIASRIAPDPVFGILAPEESMTTMLPSGLTRSVTTDTELVLSDPTDPSSWTQRTTTVTVNEKSAFAVFDKPTRTLITTSPEGRTAVVVLDAQGRPTSFSVPGLHPVQYSYDSNGRLQSITQGTGAETRTVVATYFGQDPLAPEREGYLESLSGPLPSFTTSFEPDAVGRPLSITRPDGELIALSYDAAGNVQSLTPPEQPAHGLSYTPANLVEAYTAPPPSTGGVAAITSYDYTGARRLDLLSLPGGRSVDVVYDPLMHRPQQVTTSDSSYGFGYDPVSGRVNALTRFDALGHRSVSYGFDGPLLTSLTWSGDPGLTHGSVGVIRDADFRVDQLQVNGVTVVDHVFDDDGLLTSAGPLVINRDPSNGIVTGTTIGSVTTSQPFDAFGEVEELSASYAGTLLYRNDIVLRDKLGRILEHADHAVDGQGAMQSTSYGYQYDGAGRLVTVFENGTQSDSYGYDANGNRRTHTTAAGVVTGRHDDQDRLTRYCPEDGAGEPQPTAGLPCFAYTYRDSGELLTKTDLATSGVTSYNYDEIGALRGVELPDGHTLAYELDASGRRVGKSVDGVKQWGLLYRDELKPIAQLDADNNITAVFIYATRSDVPDYMLREGEMFRVVTDHLGSVRLVVNASTGEIAQQIDYDEFGKATLVSGSWDVQPFGFAGGLYDVDTGLVRFGARDYDAVTGRWTAKDPVMFDDGTNMYAYVGNDPINFIDPLGTDALDVANWLDDSDLLDFAAGVGDAFLFGQGDALRNRLGGGGVIDTCSGWHTAGQVTGTVAFSHLGGLGIARLAGVTSRLGLHNAHHAFGRLGKLPHIQVNFWTKGVKDSQAILRIPLPSQLNPIVNAIGKTRIYRWLDSPRTGLSPFL